MRIADVISTVLYEYVIFNTVDTVLAMYEYLQLVQFVFTICWKDKVRTRSLQKYCVFLHIFYLQKHEIQV
jgi:hypothetical protein